MILLISLDLNSKTHDYNKLYDYLKSHKGWMHYLKSTWLIETDKSIDEVQTAVLQLIDKKDSGGDIFLITEVNAEPTGWMPTESWKWFDKHGLPISSLRPTTPR